MSLRPLGGTAAFAVVLTLANVAFVVRPARLERARRLAELRQQEERLIGDMAIANSLNLFRRDRERLEAAAETLKDALPAEPGADEVARQLHALAATTGLVLRVEPQAAIAMPGLEALPLKVRATGTWDQIALFSEGTGTLPRLVTLDALALSQPRRFLGQTGVEAELTLSAYRRTPLKPSPPPPPLPPVPEPTLTLRDLFPSGDSLPPPAPLRPAPPPPTPATNEEPSPLDGTAPVLPAAYRLAHREPFGAAPAATPAVAPPAEACTKSPADAPPNPGTDAEGRARSLPEAYAADDLRLVGTVAKGAQGCALLLAPDGRCLPVKVGGKVGREGGVLASVEARAATVRLTATSARDPAIGRTLSRVLALEPGVKAPPGFCAP